MKLLIKKTVYNNVHALAIELYKIANDMSLKIMSKVFKLTITPWDSLSYTLQFSTDPIRSDKQAWKVSKYGVISGMIFLYSDGIPYLSVFSPNTGKYGPEITPYLDSFNAENSIESELNQHLIWDQIFGSKHLQKLKIRNLLMGLKEKSKNGNPLNVHV